METCNSAERWTTALQYPSVHGNTHAVCRRSVSVCARAILHSRRACNTHAVCRRSVSVSSRERKWTRAGRGVRDPWCRGGGGGGGRGCIGLLLIQRSVTSHQTFSWYIYPTIQLQGWPTKRHPKRATVETARVRPALVLPYRDYKAKRFSS